VDDDGLAAIAQVDSVEQLELDGTAVTDPGVAALKSLPNLRRLTLDRAPRLTDKAVDAIKALPALTEVSVRQSRLSPKAVAELKKKDGLTVLSD
jgi:hypothetical protein